MFVCFFFKVYCDHRSLNVLPHSFPTRRSSYLRPPILWSWHPGPGLPHPRQAPFNVVDALLYHRNTVCAGEHRAWETPDLNALRTKAADHCRRGLDLDSCPRPLDRHLRAAHDRPSGRAELIGLARSEERGEGKEWAGTC